MSELEQRHKEAAIEFYMRHHISEVKHMDKFGRDLFNAGQKLVKEKQQE